MGLLRTTIAGAISFFPGYGKKSQKGTGGTDSARYCYAVWMRHLIYANRFGLCSGVPDTVAELGPGDSIGVGLAALLSGSSRYWGLDVIEHSALEKNHDIFQELVSLFESREPVPGTDEFPCLKPPLDQEKFPHDILDSGLLLDSLSTGRIAAIDAALDNWKREDSPIHYFAPWMDEDVMLEGSVDMILSQAVMEYIDDIPRACDVMWKWLRHGGFVSHQIDLKSHGLTPEWCGHWAIPDWQWFLIRGRRPYFINRRPASWYRDCFKKTGFDPVHDEPFYLTPADPRQLAGAFQNLGLEDARTGGVFIQFRKP